MCFQGQVDIGPELGNYTVSKSELIISCRRGGERKEEERREDERKGDKWRGRKGRGEEKGLLQLFR